MRFENNTETFFSLISQRKIVVEYGTTNFCLRREYDTNFICLWRCETPWNLDFMLWHALKPCILFSVFDFLHGLQFGSQPNETTVAFIGSNVTLTWNLILTAEEKKEDLEVWFGTWNKNNHYIELFLKKFTLNSSGNTNDDTGNRTLAWRWFWAGDISRDYTVAYQLTNVQSSDARDYGIRVRVDLFPPSLESRGPFSLAVKVRKPSCLGHNFLWLSSNSVIIKQLQTTSKQIQSRTSLLSLDIL